MIFIQPAPSNQAVMHVTVQHAPELQAKLFTAHAGRRWATDTRGTHFGIRGAQVISH